MYLFPLLIGLLLLLVAFAAWLLIYSDMRKIHGGWRNAKPERKAPADGGSL